MSQSPVHSAASARRGTWRLAWLAVLAMHAMPIQSLRAEGRHIPAFARKYRTGCTTCHTAPPKLNVLGEAFRLNGYRLPENPSLVRREAPLPLGEEPWKDLWPRAIWPGELPAALPLALRVQSDVVSRRGAPGAPTTRLLLPNDVYLLAGATFGGGISAFVEGEWERDGGVELVQAKVLFQDVIPALPKRLLNVMAGRQNLNLLTLGDRILDQSGRRPFAWQEYRAADVTSGDGVGGGEWSLADAMPAVSANGLVKGRLFYSAGVAQVASEDDDDGGRPLAAFYTLRLKLHGLRLDGQYDPGDGPGERGFGQLYDRSVILETFGYRGREALEGDRTGRQRAIGAAVRVLRGPLDLGAGLIRRHDRGAWEDARAIEVSGTFAKVEYLVYPWLITSLKSERFRASGARGATQGETDVMPTETSVVPGVVMLVRQNMRLVVEGEWFARHEREERASGRRPHGVAMRLDFAF